MEVRRGQRIPLAELTRHTNKPQILQIDLAISGLQSSVDFACFGLDNRQQLSDDRYMVFYNQPLSPCGGVKLISSGQSSVSYLCGLDVLPASIDRLTFTAAIDGAETMRSMQQGSIRLLDAGRELASFPFLGLDFQEEKALLLAELYRKDNSWRFSATGQGFNGGMAALVQYFGGVVADESPVNRLLSLEKKVAASAPKLVDLAKKATISLEKHRLQHTVAQVGLVLDASGSMFSQYNNGKVQQVIDRLLPLAVHFDDDGALDVWAFSNNTLALPPATLQNYENFILAAQGGWRNWGMMGVNNEPSVIGEVIEKFQASKLPVLIIFISDGGVSQNAAIKKLLVDAAKYPIFWQFVGIGGRNYGILEKLDTLPGRIVDNCGFFALDDLNSISEQALYERLLGEFPLWLEAAKYKDIV